MRTRKQYQIFNQSLAGVITIIVLSSFVLFRGTKDKSEFKKVSGNVVYLDKTFQELPNRHQGKYRYLMIDNYPKAFELFIGKDPGDFKPDYENIDSLEVGDEITIFYDETNRETDPRINRLLQFIDKQNQSYYIRGRHDKFLGYLGTIAGFFIGVWIIYLKRKGTII